MHKYMRSIGFKNLTNRKELQKLLTDVIIEGTERSYTSNGEDTLLAEFCRDFTEVIEGSKDNSIGIAVCGEFDNDDKFTYDYYFPYLRSNNISSEEDVTIERHAAQESYAGVCDDVRVGISLIFYLQNMISYVKIKNSNQLPIKGTTLTLSALSVNGSVMLPIKKDKEQIQKVKKASATRSTLMAAARKGDEDAIETLTLEDMDMYTTISKRIQNEDVFSLVDTYFMPYGVECDQYSILGEIIGIRLTKNCLTDEKIYILTICSNELTFDVSINIIDLYGEPQVGRRFKGVIWLQGHINFPV